MFPKVIYELLPYLYISTGVASGASISSAIVFIASVILIITGVLVITMRITYRRNSRRSRYIYN